MTLLDVVGESFDPELSHSSLSRGLQTRVARELMLGAHLQDRAGIPAVLSNHTMEDGFEVAIREWMGCSPLYTRRMQRLLGFTGTGMSTILKGLQLDVGFPHQFLDVGFDLHDETHAEFWLVSCGALLDVAPYGHDMTFGMCHTIEDPTFDATAVATNARAQVRPFHRPPEVPRGGPHCHWQITIADEHPEARQHPQLEAVESSRLAGWVNDPPASAEAGGWEDYAGAFDPHFELEDLSQRALAVVCGEFALQGHLLARSFCTAVTELFGADEAAVAADTIFAGVGWIESERLAKVLEAGPDAVGLASVLRLHHLTSLHDYLGLSVEVLDDTCVRLSVDDCDALAEGDDLSLSSRLLADGGDQILTSIVGGVSAHHEIVRRDGHDGHRAVWDVTVDAALPAASEPGPSRVVRVTNGPTVNFLRRRPLRR